MDAYTIVPAVALLLRNDGKLFVGRRQNTGYFDGYLNFPAGHIDPKETPRQALVRECEEEIGIKINESDLRFIHVQYNCNLADQSDRTHYYFELEGSQYNPVNAEPNKCSEVLWVTEGERLDEFVPFMKGALKAILAGEFYSEFHQPKNNV